VSDLLDLSRAYEDPLAGSWPALVLDRHRVVHAAAFRRLQGKTQVFTGADGQFRTRLTHTLEVAHLARGLAGRLGLNAELAEVVALAHDLGHPPFGHAGEQALDECLAADGGFEHNRQTLRVVERLEHPYPQFFGLNLTAAVRHCLATHHTPYDQPGGPPSAAGRAPPEGRLVDLADQIAYALHDVQDGLYAGLLRPETLGDMALWREAASAGLRAQPERWRAELRPTADRIQIALIEDICAAYRPGREPGFGPAAARAVHELGEFLEAHLYRCPRITRADAQCRQIVGALFQVHVARPELLPARYRQRAEGQGLQRVTADYLAGMTDDYCRQVHDRLAAVN
jgi:dGTPase